MIAFFSSFGPKIKITKQVQDTETDATVCEVCKMILNYQPV